MNTFLDLFLLASALFIGSFLTATALCWPDWAAVLRPRSGCGNCGRTLRMQEQIPVVSYVFQRGRCAACASPIWPGHPIGELAALLIVVAAVLVTDGPATLVASLLGFALLFGALVDARTHLLPDVVTLGLIPAGLAWAWFSHGTPGLLDSSLGAILGFSVLFLIGWLYRQLRGREGLGMGDSKLLAAGGAWCGALALPWIVAIGAGATLVFVAALALSGRKITGDLALPFGPGLAFGVFAAHLLVQPVFATGY